MSRGRGNVHHLRHRTSLAVQHRQVKVNSHNAIVGMHSFLCSNYFFCRISSDILQPCRQYWVRSLGRSRNFTVSLAESLSLPGVLKELGEILSDFIFFCLNLHTNLLFNCRFNVARGFLKANARKIIIVSYDEGRGHNAIRKLKDEFGLDTQVEWRHCDLGNLKETRTVFSQLCETEKRLDLVCQSIPHDKHVSSMVL